MTEIDSALDDIARIREQLAASSRFQGLAPSVVAITGVLALGLAAWQASVNDDDLVIWILLAAICAMLIGTEAVVRARTLHRAMADRMLSTTLNRFMPVAMAGAIVGIVVLFRAPEHSRLLPGIWQLLMGVGIFAVMSNLPRSMVYPAVFYFISGTASLSLCAGNHPAALWVFRSV